MAGRRHTTQPALPCTGDPGLVDEPGHAGVPERDKGAHHGAPVPALTITTTDPSAEEGGSRVPEPF